MIRITYNFLVKKLIEGSELAINPTITNIFKNSLEILSTKNASGHCNLSRFVLGYFL